MADSTSFPGKRDVKQLNDSVDEATAPSGSPLSKRRRETPHEESGTKVTDSNAAGICDDTEDAAGPCEVPTVTVGADDAASSSPGEGDVAEESAGGIERSDGAERPQTVPDACLQSEGDVRTEGESSCELDSQSAPRSRDVAMGAHSRDEEMDEEGGVEESGSSAGASSTKRRKQVLVGLKETDVGILEYRSHHAGIAGILKQRYRDFMVNEIDVDGKIVHLTDMKCPEKKSILPFDVNEVLTEEDQERLSVLAKGQDKSAECVIEVTEDKERRTKVHQAIRHLFPKLESTTLEDGGQKTIRVRKGGGGKHGRSRWPKDKPNYCRFVLYKENMDVYEALNIIAKYLHIGPHHFQYAGSKDKRGVTVQEVTIHRVDGQRLAQLNKVLRCIRLGNFRYVHKPLNLGELSGNHFVIILRMVKASQEQIDTAMSALRDSGFINYFGMQRFGNSLIATYLVGRALLLSQWQTAVDLILKPREEDQEDEGWRRHWMETRDAQATLAMLPNHRRRSVEQQLLRGLLKSKNDYLAAFSSIPRNTRLIYVHSYQSYIWNQITSRRLKQYGMSPVVGDLASKASIEDEDSEVPVVEYVTEENIGQFTIFDVILPLPGYSVKYPLHEAAEWYTEKLAQDGLTNEMLKHPVRDLSLTGAYRKCVVKPKNVDWALYSYDNVKIPLALTDLEKLGSTESEQLPTEGSFRALKVEFSLPSSCYATMALREVMKTDTSAVHQSQLNC